MNSQVRYSRLMIWLVVMAVSISAMFWYSGALSRTPRTEKGFFSFRMEHGCESKSITGGDTLRQEEVRTYQMTKNGNLDLSSCIGDVSVSTWDKDSVQVRWFDEKNSDAAKDLRVYVKVEGNTVRVIGTHDRGWWTWWKSNHIRFEVLVPKEFNPSVEVSGGDVSLASLAGTVKVETSGGDIVLHEIVGDVRLETSGGDITMDSITGNVFAETSGGDIRVEKVTGSLHSETSGGDITASVQHDVPDVSCETSGGDITLYIPASAKANITASTSGGSVTLKAKKNFEGRVEDDEIEGKINGGGGRIHAETSGGDIRILNL